MGVKFQVVDLSTAASPLAGGPAVGEVDLDALRNQLEQVRDALTPVLEQQPEGSIRLQTLEIDLTISLEGHIWFVAKGKGEASIRLEFARPR